MAQPYRETERPSMRGGWGPPGWPDRPVRFGEHSAANPQGVTRPLPPPESLRSVQAPTLQAPGMNPYQMRDFNTGQPVNPNAAPPPQQPPPQQLQQPPPPQQPQPFAPPQMSEKERRTMDWIRSFQDDPDNMLRGKQSRGGKQSRTKKWASKAAKKVAYGLAKKRLSDLEKRISAAGRRATESAEAFRRASGLGSIGGEGISGGTMYFPRPPQPQNHSPLIPPRGVSMGQLPNMGDPRNQPRR